MRILLHNRLFRFSRYIYVTWDPAQHNCFTNGSKMRVVFCDLLNEIQLQFESIQGVKTGVPTSDIVCLYTYANIAHITALW